MSQTIDILEREHDVVRLFALNMIEADAKALAEKPERVAGLLGLTHVDTNFLEILKLHDIRDLGLGQYLQDGYDVTPANISKDMAKLAQLSGHVLILLSSAIGERPTQLVLGQDLTLIGTYGATEVDWSADPAPAPDSAALYSSPDTGKKRPSDAAMSGRIAMLALLVLAALVLVMVWIA